MALSLTTEQDDPATLDELPPEMLVHVFICGSIWELGRAACVCHAFQKHVESALWQRAGLCGERDAPLPDGESSWVQLLCWRERRRVSVSEGTIIAGGHMHSAFADAEGRLLTCGTDTDERGFLGHGEGSRSVTTPLPLPSLGPPAERVVSVAAHTMHTLALTAQGAVYSFGHGGCGKLGHGSEEGEWMPRRIEALAHEHVSAIAAGQMHSLVKTREGRVYTFGSGFGGKLGHGSRHNQLLPKLVEGLAGVPVTAVATGSNHSLVVAEGGDVFSFGHGVMGQLRWLKVPPAQFDTPAPSASLDHLKAQTAPPTPQSPA